MRRFEFRSDSSSKFWEVEQDDAQLNLRWGKIGTHGQSQSKPFADAAKAAAAMIKLIAEKTGKGYVEAQVAAGASIGATAQPAPAASPAAALAAAIPQDTAPASPPRARAPEPVAPTAAASAPAVPAARGDSPPWLEGGAAVLMPESLKDLARPSRRHPGDAPAEPLDPMRAWLRVRESLLKHLQPEIDASAAHWQAAYAEAWQRVESRRMEGSPASDAVLMTILVKLSSQHYRDDVELGANGMAFMAGRLGLEGAVDALLTAQTMGTELGWVRDTRKRRLSLNDNVDSAHGTGYAGIHSDAEWALRALLARAEPAQWQVCADKIRAALPLLPPSRQPVMAMLLPDLPELSNETAQRLQGPQAPASLHWLQMTVTDPAALVLAQRQKVEGWGSNFWGVETMVATVLRERGADALPILAPGAAIEEAGEGLAAIGLPEAVAALARVATNGKPAMARFQQATARWPLAALGALPGLALAGGKDASLYTASLAALLQAHAAEAERVLPWLSPAEGDLVRQLQARLAQPAEAAAVEDLPTVLADPPWLGKKRVAAAGPLTLAPLDLPAVERWAEGKREEWASMSDWQVRRYDPAKARDVQLLASDLGFGNARGKQSGLLEQAMLAIRQRDAQALFAAWQALRKLTSWCSLDAMMAALLPEELALPLFNMVASESTTHNDSYMAARFGLRVLPGVLGTVRRAPTEGLPLAMPFGAVELAAPAARALARLKSLREVGRAWLLRHPEHAVAGLIPAAVGRIGEARDNAATALRMLAGEGHEVLVMDVAQRFSQRDADLAVVAAVRGVLDEDPLQRFPAKLPKLPEFYQPGSFRRPVLATGKGAGKPLPDSALQHLGTMLAFPSAEGRYPGLDMVKAACTPESLADFAWDNFAAWLLVNAPAKEGWALSALGVLGNDDTARRLTPYIRAWPGEAAHARAVAGLDVLALIGSDVALMHLNGIAQKVKFKGLQDRAREKIDEVAEARGLSLEELEDRLAPDLGLDAHGTLLLDFGPRQFRVGFDEALKPFVRDTDGARLADLPKPKKTDDAAPSKEAVERFKALKKDARTIASQQVLRLELAMCARRRWSAAVFEPFLAQHPLVRHLVQRLAWGVYRVAHGSDSGGELLACFRVAEDGSYTTADDDAYALPQGEDIRVGIPHALELPAEDAAAFGQLFADYELLQPFAQIGRDTYALTEAERQAIDLDRWKGVVIPTGKLFGLANRGWRRGAAQDGGGIWYYTKQVEGGRAIELTFDPGMIVGMPDEYPEQTLQSLQFGVDANGWGIARNGGKKFAGLDPIAASELIRDMESLRA